LKRTFLSALILIAATFMTVGGLLAHHAPSAIFDMKKPLTSSGVLTKVDWVNPHIVVFIDSKGADGTVENWKFESNPPSWFRQVGLSRADFAKAIGQQVTIGGVHAIDGSHYGYMMRITFADGNALDLAAPSSESK
jgi:hypothetical protein